MEEEDILAKDLVYYKVTFKRFDENGDGVINRKELKNVYKAMGFKGTTEQVREAMVDFDYDGSGTIDLEEFLAMLARTPKTLLKEAELRRTFRECDTNGDGNIDRFEMKKLLTMVGSIKDVSENELSEAIQQLDTNGDGTIQYEEFITIISK